MRAKIDRSLEDRVCDSPRLRKVFAKGTRSYYRCDNCGVVVLHPEPSFSELTQYYNSMPSNYRIAFSQSDSNRIKFTHLYDKYIAKYIPRAGCDRLSMIDVGCFCGDFLQVCRNRGITQIMGCEINKNAIDILHSKNIQNIKEEFIASETIRDHSADYVFMLDLIEHVTEPKAYVRKAFTTLKPGGYLFLTTPNTDSIFSKIFRSKWAVYDGMEHVRLFNVSNLSRLLREQGFSVVDKKRLFKKTTLRYFLDISAAWIKNNWLTSHLDLFKKIGKVPLLFYAGEWIVVARKQ